MKHIRLYEDNKAKREDWKYLLEMGFITFFEYCEALSAQELYDLPHWRAEISVLPEEVEWHGLEATGRRVRFGLDDINSKLETEDSVWVDVGSLDVEWDPDTSEPSLIYYVDVHVNPNGEGLGDFEEEIWTQLPAAIIGVRMSQVITR